MTTTGLSLPIDLAGYYVVSLEQAAQHVLEIALWLPTEQHHALELVFPVWTPGSYMIREYARNIEQISATAWDQPDIFDQQALNQQSQPQPVQLQRLDKHRWLLHAQPNQWICIRYRLYAREMSVRTNWLEHDYAFITGAATFPFVRTREQRPIHLELHLPDQWRDVATSLKRSTDSTCETVRLHAQNYDCLVDSPIVCGVLDSHAFQSGGAEHYLVHCGDHTLWNNERALSDIAIIVAEHQRFWGSVPYERYYFLNLITESGGGLEHDNSCVLMASRWAMRRRESYLNWLALVSHEFFHTWNVRRLRPRALMQYDYEREQYTSELWIAEGITSYFDDLALVRAGLCTREEYLARLSQNIATVHSTPGRLVQSLEDSSWDAWIKLYRPDENAPNVRISYYLKGLLVAWLLDAQLQQITERASNLDAVMRKLWEQCLSSGYTFADFARIVDDLSGGCLSQWLQTCVASCHELDYSQVLAWFGLRFKSNVATESASAVPTTPVWIGVETAINDGRLWVRRVLRDSPASRAGLNVDDELLALGGIRLEPSNWNDRLGLYQPGESWPLTISRRGKLRELQLTLAAKPSDTWQLEVAPDAPPSAAENLRVWLHQPS